MKEFTFECSNCKTKQKVYANGYYPGVSNAENRRLSAAFELLIKELGWIKMQESEVAGFHDFLCPKCK